MMTATETSRLVTSENYIPFRRLIKYHLLPITLSVVALSLGFGATVALGTGDNFIRVVCEVIGVFAGSLPLLGVAQCML